MGLQGLCIGLVDPEKWSQGELSILVLHLLLQIGFVELFDKLGHELLVIAESLPNEEWIFFENAVVIKYEISN